MKWERGSIWACVAALSMFACGGSDSVADVLADDLRSSDAFEEIDLTNGEASCAADGTVDELGDDRVVEVGLGDDDTDGAVFADVPGTVLEVVAARIAGCVEDLESTLTRTLTAGIIDEPDDTLPVSDSEARCVAGELVSGFGAERLLVLGAVTGDGDPFSNGAIADDETAIVADAFLGCLDIREVFREQFVADGVPFDTAVCVTREIPDANLRDLFAAQFAGETIDPDSLIGPALETCGLG